MTVKIPSLLSTLGVLAQITHDRFFSVPMQWTMTIEMAVAVVQEMTTKLTVVGCSCHG